ncbi:uncharacterized protein BYT42DRAFT_575062 [Radiomyces spectabilis]|uniref:uncharacterized protein n=1 Tax=Radiomyces spectabilis TaxID=64574 RepID=UPI00221E7C17|nr:uncharacterized protein BYT42DRAFT_575062 [Radiomyces spectabilis]KAI8376562.1 hypothetical protein BYT42DRAFT_575062 [Radiomyces spectabilis]
MVFTMQTSEWTVLEKLLLAQSVYKFGEDNWFQIARNLRQHAMLNRQPEFFNQKNCSLQYYLLIEDLETEKRQNKIGLSSLQEMPSVVKLARRLYMQRMDEVKMAIKQDEDQFMAVVSEIDDIRSGRWDNKLKDILQQKSSETVPVIEQPSETTTPVEPSLTPSHTTEATTKVENRINEPAQVTDISKPSIEEPVFEGATAMDNIASFNPSSENTPVRMNAETESTPITSSDAAAVTEILKDDTDIAAAPSVTSGAAVEPTVTTNTSSPITMIQDTVKSRENGSPGSEESFQSAVDEHVEPMIVDKPTVEQPSTAAAFENPAPPSSVVADQAQSGLLPTTTAALSSSLASSEQSLSTTPEVLLEESVTTDTPGGTGMELLESEHAKKRTLDDIVSPDTSYVGGETAKRPKLDLESRIESSVSTTPVPSTASHEAQPIEPTTQEKDRQRKKDEAEIENRVETESQIDAVAAEVNKEKATEKEKRDGAEKGKDTTVPTNTGDQRVDEMAGPDTFSQHAPVPSPIDTTERHVAGDTEGTESVAGTDSNAATPTTTLTPTSSERKRAKDDPRQKSWQKNINLLWREIANHKNGAMFMNPIKEATAPLYYDIVKHPMDLKTIKNRIRDGVIRTTVEFERDIMLMLTNSLMYNREGTEVYQMAVEMLDDVTEQINIFKTADGNSSASSHTRQASIVAKERKKSAVE